MIAVIILVLGIAGCIYFIVKTNRAGAWHMQGIGERKARAEYARLSREEPNSSAAKVSEAEFVQTFVSQQPGMWRYILSAVATLAVTILASCVAMIKL